MDADAHVMRQVQQGEPEAFERLVRRYQGPLYAFFIRLGGSAADAEDLVQETLLRVFKGRELFDLQRPFRSWLYGIATHVRADFVRQRSSAQATVAESGQASEAVEVVEPNDVAEQAARRDIARHVQNAMHQLPEEHRIVLILRHYHGLTYEDIGQALGISLGTVKSRIHYALAKLRAALRRRGLWEV